MPNANPPNNPPIHTKICSIPVAVVANTFPSSIAFGFTDTRNKSMSFDDFSMIAVFAVPCPYARIIKYRTIIFRYGSSFASTPFAAAYSSLSSAGTLLSRTIVLIGIVISAI